MAMADMLMDFLGMSKKKKSDIDLPQEGKRDKRLPGDPKGTVSGMKSGYQILKERGLLK